ncbi:MAG: ABC transporter substrate-binding protein [Burkholderiales bacterium]|nr:ABC transporter substrate-binding protein [Burkholderiales bacterium]
MSGEAVKIGVLTDLSGIYADIGGEGSVVAARMAVEDFGGSVLGRPIQVIFADHQNRVDVGARLAIEWIERDGVDMITDSLNSAVAIAVSHVAAKRKRIVINTGAASTRLTNEDCSPYLVHHTYDTYALAHGTARAVVQEGGKTWFFITADYPFGRSLEREAGEVVLASGGKVLGAARHPFNAKDFDPLVRAARSSGAEIIGLANAGGDMINTIRAAAAQGLAKNQSIAGLLVFSSDIHTLGLQATQGMYVTEAWYWDLNDETRAWSRRFFERTQRMPSMVHAGTYSAVTMYLRAVQATGTDDADTVMKWLKSNSHSDMFGKDMHVRPDGRLMHDMYLLQVKKPAESKVPWDYYHLRRVIPSAEAFQPLAESRCPLVRKR